jgi:predicted transcriptional regulator
MPDAIRTYLQREMECEGLLECFYGLTELDRRVFGRLVESTEPLTVDEIAATVDRERSTAYRSVERLRDAGLLEKEQVSYETGSYCHVYQPAPADTVAGQLQRELNDWYAQMGRLIEEFREKYGDQTTTTSS